MMNREAKINRTEVIKHLVLGAGALFILAPFYQMLSTSMRNGQEVSSGSLAFFPDTFYALENYSQALSSAPLIQFMLNGFIVTMSIFLLQVLVALPCAYALSKLRWWGRNAVFAMVMFCLLIPPHAVAIPVYLLLYKLGILDTYAALVVPWTISVFGIFLMRQFFMTVPNDLVDAARMDGMSEWRIIWQLMLPTAIPALTAFGIFSVIAHWNDYFWPLIVLSTESLYTPPLAIANFRTGEVGYDYGPLMATATIVITPLVLAFLLAQKRFIEGIAFSGMK